MSAIGDVLLEYSNSQYVASVLRGDDSSSLRLRLALADPGPEPTDLEGASRIISAATIVLELDASVTRALNRGDAIELRVNSPREMPARHIESLEDAELLRPRIEELVSPLLFGELAHPAIRPFQEEGIDWLLRTPRAILADDMGLGKTAQALLAAQCLVLEGSVRTALVVCPKSLAFNWASECLKWVPAMAVIRASPTAADAADVWRSILGRAHLILCSYEQIRALPPSLVQASHALVIADEAHRLRRDQAQLVRAFRQLSTSRLWALTGTPIERHRSDFATLLSLLEPRRFSARSLLTEYELKSKARSYILRRRKADVLAELPSVIEAKESLELTRTQRQRYVAIQAKPVEGNATDVLRRLMQLRAICDVDTLSDSSTKLDRIVEILAAVDERREKAIVFSYLLRPLQLLSARLASVDPKIGAELFVGEMSSEERILAIDRFKGDDQITALLCSSRVGGEGLTLTEANHVLFLNEWWNPSANNQARDRVVRWGQERVVQVHRFRCHNTVEDVLDDILNEKTEAFSRIIDGLATEVGLDSETGQELVTTALGNLDRT